MTILDISPSSADEAVRGPIPNEGAYLPVTAGAALEAAWDEGRYFTMSNARENARVQALTDYVGEIRKKTGRDLTGEMGDIVAADDWSTLGPAVNKVRQAFPDAGIDEFSLEMLDKRAQQISRAARKHAQELAGRDRTFGAGVGSLLGGLETGVADPLNLATAPFALEGGVFMTGLKMAALAGGTETVNQLLGAPYREAVQPGYVASGEPGLSVLQAAGGGFALGAGTRMLGNLWARLKTGAWPTTVRDAGNIAESELNFQRSNVYPGVGGEVAHRDAIGTAIDQVVKGEPVDVNRPLATLEDQPQLPLFAARAGEPADQALRNSVAQAAARGGHDLAPGDAVTIAEHLADQPADAAAAAMKEVQVAPHQLADQLDAERKPSERLPDETEKQFAKRVIDKRPEPGPDELPEGPERYFDPPEGAQSLELDNVLSQKSDEANALSAPNAAKRMLAASKGELTRRGAITVTPLGNGKFIVVDGNATFSAAKKLGWKSLPATVVDRGLLNDEAKLPQRIDQAKRIKRIWADQSPIKTVDDLYAHAEENQAALIKAGAEASAPTGIPVSVGTHNVGPLGIKLRSGADDKMALTGKGPGAINDIVRIGFDVKTPAQSDEILAGLAKRLPIIDESWERTATGYFDRKVLVRFPNGQVGEVQFWVPGMLEAKQAGGGHAWYKEWKKLPEDDPRKAELHQKQVELYGGVADRLGPEWDPVKASFGIGGNAGNVALKAAAERTLPSSPTAAVSMRDQVAPGNVQAPSPTSFMEPPVSAQASVGVHTTGLPSQSMNVADLGKSIAMEPSAPTVAAGPQEGKLIGAPVASLPAHKVTATGGRMIDVQPVVVEAAELKTSADAGYTKELQPRQRERAASQAQIRDIVANLDPQRLGDTTRADTGAPIVGPDAMVESGNGRVLALRQVYAEGGAAAQRYREFLESQGIDVSQYKEPVLIRQRTSELAPAERQAFTVEANQSGMLAMGATERALSDRALMTPDLLEAIKNPEDLSSPANTDFHRGFIARLPVTERGALMDAKGRVSAEGVTRMRNAMLASAYGDAESLSRIAESTDDEIKGISNALIATAGHWAGLRADIGRGLVKPEMDITNDLMEAVDRTEHLRRTSTKLSKFLSQQDAFDQVPPRVEALMKMFYDPSGNKAAGWKGVADKLTYYAEEARKVSPTDLGLLEPVTPDDILQLAARRGAKGAAAAEAPDLFAKPGEAPRAPGAATEAMMPTREELAKTLQDPKLPDAMQADVDRARMTKDIQVPAGVDERGEPVFQSVDRQLADVEELNSAAEQLEACAGPAPQKEAA